MTPTEIETAARNKYNAVGDTFFSSDEVLNLMTEASMQLALEALVIEDTDTQNTVIGTQAYTFPTRAYTIKRVTWDGNKLMPMTFREDDILTLNNSTSSETGVPQFYYIWENQVFLRPIPASVAVLKVYSYLEPAAITALSTLEVPTRYHRDLVNFIVSEMAAKDNNMGKAQYYQSLWLAAMSRAKRETRKRLRGDAPAHVQVEEVLINTLLGTT